MPTEPGGDIITNTVNMNNNYITNLPAPVSGGDAINKTYADNLYKMFTGFTDVTASRAFNAVYRNVNTFAIMAVIDVTPVVQSLSSTDGILNGESTVWLALGTDNPPVTYYPSQTMLGVALSGLANATLQIYSHDTISLIIPPNYYYQLTKNKTGHGIDPSINWWTEYGGTGTAV